MDMDIRRRLGIIERGDAVFVMVDVQDRLLESMHEGKAMLANANKLAEASRILGIPLIVTEQYPKGLGHTSGKILLPQGAIPIEKITFSCFGSEDFRERLQSFKRNTLVMFGTEAHICVLMSALDAAGAGFQTHVVTDAVSSRRAGDRDAGIQRMRQSGIFMASTETVLFQLMEKAGSEEFKAVSALIK